MGQAEFGGKVNYSRNIDFLNPTAITDKISSKLVQI